MDQGAPLLKRKDWKSYERRVKRQHPFSSKKRGLLCGHYEKRGGEEGERSLRRLRKSLGTASLGYRDPNQKKKSRVPGKGSIEEAGSLKLRSREMKQTSFRQGGGGRVAEGGVMANLCSFPKGGKGRKREKRIALNSTRRKRDASSRAETGGYRKRRREVRFPQGPGYA